MPDFYLGEMLDKQKPYPNVSAEPYLRDGVAVIPVIGPITRYSTPWSVTSTEKLLHCIRHYEEQGVEILLHLDCPGGSASALFELTEYIRDSKVKITSYVGDLAASAGYLIASATQHITSSEAGYVGSVGAIIQLYIGMEDEIKTYTSAISPMKHLPEGKKRDAEIQKQVDRIGEMFVNDLTLNMGIEKEVILSTFGRGALVPSEDALAANMIHSIGSFESLFSKEKGVLMMTEAEMRAEMKSREAELRAEFTLKQELLVAEIAKTNETELSSKVEAAKVEAIANESKRIVGINALAITGHDALITEMKADPSVTIEMAAVRILTAETTSQAAALANLKVDAVEPVDVAPVAVEADAKLLAEFGGDQSLVDLYLDTSKSGAVVFNG